MANILVFIETKKDEIREFSLEALNTARKIADASGGKVYALLVGKTDGFDDTLAHYGADVVYKVTDERLSNYLTVPYAKAVKAAMDKAGASVFLLSATSLGKDLAPRVAAKFGVPMVSDITGLEYKDGKFEIVKPLYAGKVYGTFELSAEPAIISLRPKIFEKGEPDSSRSASSEELTVDLTDDDFRAKVVEVKEKETGEIDVTEADIIVSGGRGVKGPEGFELLRQLIEVLNKAGVGKVALGASRVAVDSGWIDHSHQVGQTGKVVAPKLYMAFGISGAIQHLAGMRTSKVIVAVNKDPEAPIFKVADYGLVEDLFKVVPEMIKELKEIYKVE